MRPSGAGLDEYESSYYTSDEDEDAAPLRVGKGASRAPTEAETAAAAVVAEGATLADYSLPFTYRLRAFCIPAAWRPVLPDGPTPPVGDAPGAGIVPLVPGVQWPASVRVNADAVASSGSGLLPDPDIDPNWALVTQVRGRRRRARLSQTEPTASLPLPPILERSSET